MHGERLRHGSLGLSVGVLVICLMSVVIGGGAAAAAITDDPPGSPGIAPDAGTPRTSAVNLAVAPNGSETMGTVQVGIPYIVDAADQQLPVAVTKLNTTTFRVTHKHNGTSRTWFIANHSLWKNGDAGWAGRLGTETDTDWLGWQIEDTTVFDTQIYPFIKKVHEPRRLKKHQKRVKDRLIPDVSFDPVKRFRQLVDALLGLPGWIVTQANNWIFGVPAPGSPTKPSTWLNPPGIWAGIAAFTTWTTGFATLILAYTGGLSFARSDAYARRQAWKRWGIAVLMVLGTWTLVPLGLHMANEVSQMLRPETAEIFHSWASVSKVGTGLGLAALLGIFQPAIFGIGAFVLAVERVIIYITVGVWPLAWALRSTNNDIARSLGQLSVFMLAMVLATKLGQALMARLLFSLNWTLGSAVEMLLVLGAGVAFMLIYFPYKMLQHANSAASISLGMGAAAKTSGRASERASERVSETVGHKYESLKEWRETDDPDSSIPEHKRQVGQVGNSRADGDRTDYSASSTATASGRRGFDASHGFDAAQTDRDQEHIDDLNKGIY